MSIRMSKYHGLGNDYLVLDPNKNDIRLQQRKIEMICKRNFGVGSDGILYGPVLEAGKLKLGIYNPDGSEAEQSGNGLCIFAKYLFDHGYVSKSPFTIWTKAGAAAAEYLDPKGEKVCIDMGEAVFAAGSIPLAGGSDEMMNEPVMFHDELYNVTCLSVGNPHCVIMIEDVSRQKAEELGPYVEQSGLFPNRINMQLMKILDRKNIRIEVYERGAGYTLASGTSACAAAAAACRLGLADQKLTIHMPGGEMEVEVRDNGHIYMTGKVVYIGEINLAEDFFA